MDDVVSFMPVFFSKQGEPLLLSRDAQLFKNLSKLNVRAAKTMYVRKKSCYAIYISK